MSRHKVFISYHHADQSEVNSFITTFADERNVFIKRGVGIEIADDIINSDNPDYVMRRIRDLYLKDSTITLVLIGKCTWARRYVDWEIQASLRRSSESPPPNGLLGIKLPSYSKQQYPDRLNSNLKQDDCMFQAKSTADSDASRPLVPVDVDQRFRCKASTN
jgi:hypothetical protein